MSNSEFTEAWSIPAEMNVETLKREALRLSPEDRARLATDLLESLDELSPENPRQLWLEEAARRGAQIDSGEYSQC